MDEKGRPVTDWQLERLAQGELDPATARELERKLGPEELRARLARLTASNREILERLPPEVVGPAIRRRLDARRPARGRMLMMLLVPVAAAAGLFTLRALPRHAAVDEDETILIKGSTRLVAYRAAAGARPARLGEAAWVRPHDLIQLAYTSPDARYGVILSVDGRGVVTQHLPVEAATQAVPLSPAGEVQLPRAYELDDAPGFERFFLITAPRSFSAADVLAAARSLARTPDDARRKPLPLTRDLAQQSLLLEKVQP
jgi:hypothetical protein